MAKLTNLRVQKVKAPGAYSDGTGLYLNVAAGGTKSWIFRGTVKGRVNASGNPYRTEVGLGSVADVSLADARAEAIKLRAMARAGKNPLDEKRREKLTFEDAARRVYSNLLPTWRNKKHGEVWIASMEGHVFPRIGARGIETVGTADVLAVLEPIWTSKNETARRVKQRISTVFDWAKGAGHYPHENPVNGLKRALPSVSHKPTHMAALDWRRVPAFMSELADREGTSARTLEFIILTCCRSGEVRGARWSEVDLETKTWTIPGHRMKIGDPHRVPLSPQAVAVLEQVRGLDKELVFPSARRKGQVVRQQSVMVFKALLKRMKHDHFTVHGFRSSFRDWCSESARAEWEVAEACLAHTVGNEVERSYARSDLFDRRRVLMERWADHVTGGTGAVVRMVGR